MEKNKEWGAGVAGAGTLITGPVFTTQTKPGEEENLGLRSPSGMKETIVPGPSPGVLPIGFILARRNVILAPENPRALTDSDVEFLFSAVTLILSLLFLVIGI